MKRLNWDEFYDRFYDWSPSTQKKYASCLTNFGSSQEVFEIILEYAFSDKHFASRFARKACDAGVGFQPDEILEFIGILDQDVIEYLALNTAAPFDREQLEEINMLISDEAFGKLSERAGVDIFADDEMLEDDLDDLSDDWEPAEPAPKKIGFWGTLFAMIGASELMDNKHSHKHSGKCDGDRAHCPPHYGYRYGRWYYGHGHQYGCEFGGNKGDGSI